jgi:sugar lactone lactonase YvrE
MLVEPEEPPRVVADGLRFPNGMVITPNGPTLIVAERMGPVLQAYDIRPTGDRAHCGPWATAARTKAGGSKCSRSRSPAPGRP